MTTSICPRCNRSVYTYKTVKKDPKTKKSWMITSCSKCEFHLDLEEHKEPDDPPRDPNKGWLRPAW